ncbi:MAG: hypothetical protein WCK76_10250 [Elusimicrobiota bacterium]
MKNILTTIFTLALAAGTAGAEDVFNGGAAGLLAGVAAVEVPAPPPPDGRIPGAVRLKDPATGATRLVLPVSGGFVDTVTGAFIPALLTVRGYLLANGRLLAFMKGGARGAGPEDAAGTILLIDPETSAILVVQPVSGGFVDAKTGRFTAASRVRDGYVLEDGRQLLFIRTDKAPGGSRAGEKR